MTRSSNEGTSFAITDLQKMYLVISPTVGNNHGHVGIVGFRAPGNAVGPLVEEDRKNDNVPDDSANPDGPADSH